MPPASDSLHYADIARNLLRGNGFEIDFIEYHLGLRPGVRHVPEHHGILRPLALAPLFAVFGTDPALLRVPGQLYRALAGVVGFFLARRLFGTAAGVVATLLILGDGLLGVTALNGSDDMGFAFFCLCTIAALERGLRGGRDAWFALAGLAAGFAVLEKQIGVFLPAVLVAPLVVAWRAPSLAALRRDRARARAVLPLLLALSRAQSAVLRHARLRLVPAPPDLHRGWLRGRLPPLPGDAAGGRGARLDRPTPRWRRSS